MAEGFDANLNPQLLRAIKTEQENYRSLPLQGMYKPYVNPSHIQGVTNGPNVSFPNTQGWNNSSQNASFQNPPAFPPSKGRKSKEPSTFDGKSCDWRDYIIHFECVAAWNCWSEQEKIQQLIMSLRGQAQKMLGELDLEQLRSYQLIKTFIGRRFNPIEREPAYRCEFRNRKQQRQETASDFGYSLQRLCIQAFPNINAEAREIYLIDQFIHGLSRPDLRSHIQYRHPNTIDAAIALAVEFEAFEGSQGILRKPHFETESQINTLKSSEHDKSQGHSSREDTTTLHDIAKLLQDLMITIKRSNSCNSSRSRSNSADRRLKLDSIECYRCHKKGHIASNCDTKQEN